MPPVRRRRGFVALLRSFVGGAAKVLKSLALSKKFAIEKCFQCQKTNTAGSLGKSFISKEKLFQRSLKSKTFQIVVLAGKILFTSA